MGQIYCICPDDQCRAVLRAEKDMAGKQVTCSACSHSFVVPPLGERAPLFPSSVVWAIMFLALIAGMTIATVWWHWATPDTQIWPHPAASTVEKEGSRP